MAFNPIKNGYDANNRLTFKDLSDNTNSQDISYGYDLRGLTLYSCFGATTACDESGEGETNKFDDFGNLEWRKSRMFGTTRQLSYLYDLEGNRTRITHPDDVYFTYGRDGLNRVCTLGESASAPDCDLPEADDYLAMHYSAEGRRADITRPGSVTGYDTDNALRLKKFTQDFALTANDLTNEFGYNPAGQVTLLTQSNTQYNYTEAQNRVGAYGVNGLNQYTSIDGTTVAYDTNGNLTADGAGMTFFYDMENRLVSTGTPASGLYYDVLGRLARVTVAGATTDFHYDGDALVGEYVGTPLTRRYVHSGEVDEPLVQYDIVSGVATKHYLHADHQGSIIAHSDSSGAATQKNSYDPYGIPKSTNDGRFGYTGQTWLKELGLNYYKARFYAPKLGRFLQTDPIFYKDDMNLYAYVGSDPFNRTDPTGENCRSVDGTTVCDPIDPDFQTQSAPMSEEFEDFENDDWDFHHYRFEDSAGQGDAAYGEALKAALINHPSADNPATEEGTLNDVGPLHLGSGVDEVKSYKTNEGVFNVTESNHAVSSGFVMRKIVSDGAGGFKIVTIGEGNSLKQVMPGAGGAAGRFWTRSAEKIMKEAMEAVRK